MNGWTDEHRMLVAEANPVAEPGQGSIDRAWAQVSSEMGSVKRPKRSRKAIFAGIAAVAVVAVGGTAAASVLSSHTGVFDRTQEDRTAGGPGERLNPRGADFRQVAAQETSDIPFPSTTARTMSLDFQVKDLGGGSGKEQVRVSTSALRGFVANDAICSWANEWARAIKSGDSRTASRAAGILESAPDWKAVATLQAIDPVRFEWLAGVERAALGDSVPAMGTALAGQVFCIPGLVPDLPEALPSGGIANPGSLR